MNHMVLHVCVIYLLNDYTSFLIHHLPLVCLAKSELDLLYFRRFKTFTEQQNFSYLEAFGPHLRPCSPHLGWREWMTSLAGRNFLRKPGVPRVDDGTVDPWEGVSAAVSVLKDHSGGL